MAKTSDIADFYISMYEESVDQMTNLRLNKFLYFAQGWSLVRLGKPLFDEDIQAWKYGPVVPSVYETYKVCGRNPLDYKESEDFMDRLSKEQIDLLIDVAMEYGDYSTEKLVSMSHEEGSPWSVAYDSNHLNKTISKDALKGYFSKLRPLKPYRITNIPGIEVYHSPYSDGRVVLPSDFDD